MKFSMKNVFKFLGIVALTAVIGFSGVSCSNGSTDDNSPPAGLAAKWWDTQVHANVGTDEIFYMWYDIKSNGDFWVNGEGTIVKFGTISFNGASFTISVLPAHGGGTITSNWSLSGTTLTISGLTSPNTWMNGTFFKKAS